MCWAWVAMMKLLGLPPYFGVGLVISMYSSSQVGGSSGNSGGSQISRLRVLFIGLVLLLDLTWSKIAPFDS